MKPQLKQELANRKKKIRREKNRLARKARRVNRGLK